MILLLFSTILIFYIACLCMRLSSQLVYNKIGGKFKQMYNKYFRTEDDFEMLDIFELFNYYNAYFFEGKLEKSFVQWSQKMTLCAGTCTHSSHQSCTIRLSAPLLQYRSANELKETLLHQMIHAFLFVTNPRACVAEGGHGKQFQQIMRNINEITKLNVTIYHNFKDQVDMFRKHIWRCNGLCQTRPPFYGYVKRAMNRKPQPADPWFNDHKRTCGGDFIKISGPEDKPKNVKKNNKKSIGQFEKQSAKAPKSKNLKDYFKEAKIEKKVEKQNVADEKQVKTIEEQSVKLKQKSFSGSGKTIEQYCIQMEMEAGKQ